jgi:phosphoribosylglycinamide formyltransferase-1
MKLLTLGILGSGKGTNCRAILERIRSGLLPAEAHVVISDVLNAPILDIAREFSIPNAYLPPGRFRTRLERVLKSPMLEAFPRRILNIHPALLPKFPGLEAWNQALAAGEKVTGCTVHYVDEEIDHGDIIAQREVPILPNDSPETLHARIQIAEHELYPAAIAEFCRN